MVGRSSAESDTVENTEVDELPVGTPLMNGAYTIESFLNAGGFGMTYVARDSLNRRVVIKECFPAAFCRRKDNDVQPRSRGHDEELESVVRLFVNEAKSLAKLEHPGVVGVHQVFEENNTAYMALDFVAGRDLLDVLVDPDLKLGAADVEMILRRLLDAVGFVHEAGILHRDISPDNILLDDNLNPVLIDFGAAREQATKKTRVMSALRVVKDGYSPQEFYIGGSEQGPFSDLYSLGACFYHLLTDELPPDGQVRVAALASGEKDPYRPLLGRIEGFSEDFLKAIDKSLAVLPKDRVRSAAEWLQIMEGGKAPAQPVTQLEIKRADAAAGEAEVADAVPDIQHVGAQGSLVHAATEDAASPSLSAAPNASQQKRETPVIAKMLASVAAIAVIGVAVATQTDLLGGSDTPEETAVLIEPVIPSPVTGTEADTPILDLATVPSTPETTAEATAPETPFATPTPDESTETAVTDIAIEPEEAVIAAPVETPVVEDAPADVDVAALPTDGAIAAVPADPVSGVSSSSWTVALPFGLSFDPSGERIVAVNGVPVETREDFDAALLETVDPGDATSVALEVAVGRSTDDSATQAIDVPVIHRLSFPAGLRFETRHDGTQWRTRISAVPSDTSLEIEVNDQVLALLNTNEVMDDFDSLPSILERVLASDPGTLMFAVQRNGENWAIAVPSEMLLDGAGG